MDNNEKLNKLEEKIKDYADKEYELNNIIKKYEDLLQKLHIMNNLKNPIKQKLNKNIKIMLIDIFIITIVLFFIITKNLNWISLQFITSITTIDFLLNALFSIENIRNLDDYKYVFSTITKVENILVDNYKELNNLIKDLNILNVEKNKALKENNTLNKIKHEVTKLENSEENEFRKKYTRSLK